MNFESLNRKNVGFFLHLVYMLRITYDFFLLIKFLRLKTMCTIFKVVRTKSKVVRTNFKVLRIRFKAVCSSLIAVSIRFKSCAHKSCEQKLLISFMALKRVNLIKKSHLSLAP